MHWNILRSGGVPLLTALLADGNAVRTLAGGFVDVLHRPCKQRDRAPDVLRAAPTLGNQQDSRHTAELWDGMNHEAFVVG